jgi:hypothetical protein
MPIEFTCPGCQQTLRVPDSAARKQAKCPKCQQLITVPDGSTSSATNQPALPQNPPQKPPPPTSLPNPFGPDNSAGTPNYGGTPGYGAPNPLSDNPYAPSALPGDSNRVTGGTGPIGNAPCDISDVISHGWECFQRDFLILTFANLIAMLIPVIFAIPIGAVFFLSNRANPDVALLAMVGIPCVILVLLSHLYFMLGKMSLSLASARGEHIEIGMLFYQGGNGVGALLGILLFNIVTTLLVIFFCSGLIVLLFYWPLYFILVDKKTSLGESFSLAKTVTAGNAGTTVLLVIIGVAISVGLSAVCTNLIMIILQPFISLLWATAYLMMSAQLRRGNF